MHDVMLDLETMGTGTVGERFYRAVDLATSVSMGGEIDASTVLWWMQRGDEARAASAQPLPAVAWPAATTQAAMNGQECRDCARSCAGLWCGYFARCPDCTARAIARSLPAFNALHHRGTGERDDLRATIRLAMPTTDYATACRMVRAWWEHDHPPAKAPA